MKSAGYSEFYIAFTTLFRALLGDLDFEEMQDQAGRVIAPSLHPSVSFDSHISYIYMLYRQ